jgi:hypothetical protein
MKEMSSVVSDQEHECMTSNVAMWPYMACYAFSLLETLHEIQLKPIKLPT